MLNEINARAKSRAWGRLYRTLNTYICNSGPHADPSRNLAAQLPYIKFISFFPKFMHYFLPFFLPFHFSKKLAIKFQSQGPPFSLSYFYFLKKIYFSLCNWAFDFSNRFNLGKGYIYIYVCMYACVRKKSGERNC